MRVDEKFINNFLTHSILDSGGQKSNIPSKNFERPPKSILSPEKGLKHQMLNRGEEI